MLHSYACFQRVPLILTTPEQNHDKSKEISGTGISWRVLQLQQLCVVDGCEKLHRENNEAYPLVSSNMASWKIPDEWRFY